MKKLEISSQWITAFLSLNEPQRRWFAAVKAQELGYGGISAVSKATGLSRTTINQGIEDLEQGGGSSFELVRQRRQGAGRKRVVEDSPELIAALERLVDESSAGDPMSRIKWTCKSTRSISAELKRQGFKVSHVSVLRLLREAGYSLRTNKKMLSGVNHPDRNDQFRNINAAVNRFTKRGNPVISVDTKKKELVGNFKNNGRTWSKTDIEVLDHDFVSYGNGKAIPYGAYDINRNEGFVNVGMSSDTSEFAVNSIWQWWRHFGRKHYQDCSGILVCADGGGSNGSRARAWKFYLQELANKIGKPITVAHYPPGTSKWNKIEHKMFSFISLNWKGRPLENYEAVVRLISSTTTKSGLKVKARLDKKRYRKGTKISDEEFEEINLKFAKKFPRWNYTIDPI